MTKIVLALSGGMDSATLLAEALYVRNEVVPVMFGYGSKHNQYEHRAAKLLLDRYQLLGKHHFFDLEPVMKGFQSDLLKTGGDIPEGHYEEKSMSKTVVPGRNIIFTSILSGLAWSIGAKEVWLGVHSGDHAIYPDCRPEFFFSMKEAIEHGTDGNVSLRAPFLHMNKTLIVRRGLELMVPYDYTRTCYKDQEIACGKCGSCQERLEAFKNNEVQDPIDYETRQLMPKVS